MKEKKESRRLYSIYIYIYEDKDDNESRKETMGLASTSPINFIMIREEKLTAP